MDLYIFSPFGPTFWLCSLVLTRSSGKTHVTPMMPAMPPLMIFGSRLEHVENKTLNIYLKKKHSFWYALCQPDVKISRQEENTTRAIAPKTMRWPIAQSHVLVNNNAPIDEPTMYYSRSSRIRTYIHTQTMYMK